MSESPEVRACRLAAPAYLTGLSALAWHQLAPHTVARPQVATLRHGEGAKARRSLDRIALPRDLFDGYVDAVDPFTGESFPLAEPEKALVDYLWYCESSGRRPALDGIDFDALDARRVTHWAMLAGVHLDPWQRWAHPLERGG